MQFNFAGSAAYISRQDGGIDVPLSGPSGEPYTNELGTDGEGKPITEPVVARVAGAYSTTYREAIDAMREKNQRRRSTEPLSVAELDRQGMEVNAKCVRSWNLRDGETPIPCTFENVLKVFEHAPWIYAQVTGAIADVARFQS